MILTSAERVLVHLHGFWNAREPSREIAQAGIAEATRILPSHVPRALQALEREGLVRESDARLRGRSRKVRVYALTEAGVRRARELIDAIDAEPVFVDGRHMNLGEARRALGASPLIALSSVDPGGRLQAPAGRSSASELLQREEDLAFLRRWIVGGAAVAVIYGSRGMGKTALGRGFAARVPRTAWIDLQGGADLRALADAVAGATGERLTDPEDPRSLARAILAAFDAGTRLLVVDGFAEASEDVVETLRAAVRLAPSRTGVHLLVLAQETTPAYSRFYGRADLEAHRVVERHLKGLDLEGCRQMLGRPDIDEEALRRIYLLTKGCPLHLRYIREGDEEGLRANSRFTKAEVRLLLHSGGVRGPASSAS